MLYLCLWLIFSFLNTQTWNAKLIKRLGNVDIDTDIKNIYTEYNMNAEIFSPIHWIIQRKATT